LPQGVDLFLKMVASHPRSPVTSRTLSLLILLAATGGPAGAELQRDTTRGLPAPTGPHAVGTVVTYLVDSTRTNVSFPHGRPIVLQLWYPAAGGHNALAPYLIEPGLLPALLTSAYYSQDTATLRSWSTEATHSRNGAAVAPGRHSLVTFSVGLGVIRANYTSLAEEMASHGVIVALVESPLEGLFVLPDGAIITDTTSQLQDPANHRAAVRDWSRDVSAALDRLQTGHVPGVTGSVARSIDWSRIGASGHSSGGLVAISACELDRRVRACIDLDGGFASPEGQPIADFVITGTSKPTFILRSEPDYSDADLAKRGLTRAAWEQRGEAGRLAFDSLIARAHAPMWTGRVHGTGHFSFSDAPFVMPSTITRFGGRLLTAQRSWEVITGAMRAFVAQELEGDHDALRHFASNTPELDLR
jgi:hypothetical protein